MTVYHSVWAIFCKKARVRSSFGSAKNSREGACSTTTPFSMNTVLEETLRAKPISWVTTSMVMPSSASWRITQFFREIPEFIKLWFDNNILFQVNKTLFEIQSGFYNFSYTYSIIFQINNNLSFLVNHSIFPIKFNRCKTIIEITYAVIFRLYQVITFDVNTAIFAI